MMRLAFAALVASLMLSPPSWAQDATGEPVGESSRPQQLVEELHAGLLDIMKRGPELGLEGRIAAITPVIKETFDLRILAASSIGTAIWSTWSDEQKDAYVKVFERFLIVNYAHQFKSYSGQSFETLAMSPGPKETFVVKTHLVRRDKEPVELSYLTREREGRMGIIDVYADGTSEAGRRRSDFNESYRQRGFDALLAEIEGLTAGLVADETQEG